MAPKVPEHVLKKRKAQQEIAEEKTKAIAKAKSESKVFRKRIYDKAKKYQTEYKQADEKLVRMRREAKKHGNFYMEPEPKVVLVVRIRGINAVEPKTKKILQLMRLRQINNAVFLKVNSASINMLRYVAPYVTFGSPNLKTVRELVYKRGFASVNKQRMPITDNQIIADNLGKYGIECTEDLIHEIFTAGKNFKEANKFMWPFKLSCAKGGMPKKRISYITGGQFGDREQAINTLVRKMN
eukprot:CAMPEP_0184301166 /NCGR_PEP_ID=MMETSP1049-20130417/11425_1 /TAXON_ID=77928 /ORGANISM="Proteomonas sulcata, Strain CCMP704" /LENGTH=239 /DNA_ID=CAMNT_0026612083 /DNA_START=10 /DNA_END=729 /DNA_ORIENTATION=-